MCSDKWPRAHPSSSRPPACTCARTCDPHTLTSVCHHNMYVRVPREVWLRETGKAPIKTGWVETDKGQPGKPSVSARWVAKEYKTHARPELYASTPPVEALKVVLSEIATGEREGKGTGIGRRAEGVFLRSSTKKSVCRIAARGLPAGDELMCGRHT